MSLWFTAVQTILPLIIDKATPHFTKQKGGDPLLQRQIDELQQAVAQNAEHIKELAEQLRAAAGAIEQAQASAARAKWALALAAIALLAALAVGIPLLAAR